MPDNSVTITISPTDPTHGDELTVTIEGSEGLGVFNVVCTNDAGDVIYGDGGNANDPTVTLSSLAWTQGGAHCTINAVEQRKNGRTYVAESLEFDVAD